MVTLGSVPSVMKGARVALRTKNTKKGLLSTKRDLQKKLNVKRAVNTIKSVTGKTRGQTVRQLGSAIAKGVYKGGGKDLAVNTGGFAGSVAAFGEVAFICGSC